MQAINTSRKRLIGITLAVGIAIGGVLAPLNVSATDQEASGHEDVVTLRSDDAFVIVAEQTRHLTVVPERTEADLTTDRHGADAFPSCQFTQQNADSLALARKATRERQARSLAEAYVSDSVYTLYDADSVLASNLPEATKSAVLGMIAPTVLLAIHNGHNGVYV